MKLKSLTFILLLISLSIKSMSQQKPNLEVFGYIKEPGLLSMSKEEFLKVDSISVYPSTTKLFTYTVILAPGCGKPLQFVDCKGYKIPLQMKEWVKQRDSCIISFDDLSVQDHYGFYKLPPFVISVK